MTGETVPLAVTSDGSTSGRSVRSRCGEDVELAQLRIAAIERGDQFGSIGHQHAGPAAGRERDVALGLGIERPAGRERQGAVVDLQRHQLVLARDPLREQPDRQLTELVGPERHQVAAGGRGKGPVGVLFLDHASGDDGVDQLDAFTRGMIFGNGQIVLIDQSAFH